MSIAWMTTKERHDQSRATYASMKQEVDESSRKMLLLLAGVQLALTCNDANNQWHAISDIQVELNDRFETHLKLLDKLEREENSSLYEVAPWARFLKKQSGDEALNNCHVENAIRK